MNARYRQQFAGTVPQQPPSLEPVNYNVVRDWSRLQGSTNPGDYYQIQRDVNSRMIWLENSGLRPVSFAITTSMGGPELPKPEYTIPEGQSMFLGLNDVTGPSQFIYLFDPVTKKLVGPPTVIRRNSNTLVLRDGLSQWWVQFFHKPPYRGTRG